MMADNRKTAAAANDVNTTIADLRRLLADFVAARDWSQFHDAKNLSMSLAIEAAELMEHFQWLKSGELSGVANDPARKAEIAEELADVLCYALSFANALDIDIAQCVRTKIAKNEQKYPADEFRGRYGVRDESPRS
jgi:dCTP diphosphatase